MFWFNFYGIIIIAAIMIPNIIFAIKNTEGFENKYKNKLVEILEQIGRFGSIIFMIFNMPYLCLGYWFGCGELVYLIVNAILCCLYIALWIIFWNKNGMLKALLLSVLPSLMFLFSGIILLNIPLIATSIIFSIGHIMISCKNTNFE